MLGRTRQEVNIWPGFVDALASLLIVIIFLLMLFFTAQVVLGFSLSRKTTSLSALHTKIDEIGRLLDMETQKNKTLHSAVVSLEGALATQKGHLQATLSSHKAFLAEKAKEIQTLAETLTRAQGQNQEHVVREAALVKKLQLFSDRLQTLNTLLTQKELETQKDRIHIESLGKRLNAALASKVSDLSRYRSEFFGSLKKILGERKGIRIVGDRFIFQSEILFPSASAILQASGEKQLITLAQRLKRLAREIPKKIHWILQIEGHTDIRPIKTDRYASNWDLSVARATHVVKFLQAHGIPPSHLSAAGFGPYQPDGSVQDYQRNRRIELKLTQR